MGGVLHGGFSDAGGWGWAPLPPLNRGRNVFVRDPRRRYRRSMTGQRAARHEWADFLYQKKRKAKS